MALIKLASFQFHGGEFPSSLGDALDVSGWTFGYNASSGSFQSPTSTPREAPSIVSFGGTGFGIDPKTHALTGTVTSVSYGTAYINGQLPQFTVTGLHISLADFYAASGNILALLTAGSDTIIGSNGNNVINAGGGNDVVFARSGDDTVYGDEGNDILYGEAGNDHIFGGTGNDLLIGGAGADELNGGTGIDTADYRQSGAGVTINLIDLTGHGGDAQGDTFLSVERIYGSNFADVVTADQGDNLVYGFGGNDVMYGLNGNDILAGGDGNDVIFGGDGNDNIGGGAGTDLLRGDGGNDHIYGGDGGDNIQGNAGNDVIFGEAGNDAMNGGAGNDYIVLGAGNDVLALGAGLDLVRFDYGNGHDRILDFKAGEDKIDFTFTDMSAGVLEANTQAVTGGVLMTLGSGSIFLDGVDLATLDFGRDFLYGH